MPLLAVLVIVAVGAILWARSLRQMRRRWLERLDLPGTWLWQGEDGELELSGSVDRGRYRLRDRDEEEQGEWRLAGHLLILAPSPAGTPATLDLRMFKEGTIGLHGPGRERRIYVKKRANVVPLRRPA
jgi:hypothetical protein